MNTCLAIVFSSNARAHVALPKLWDRDAGAELTVHRAAILCHDDVGHVRIADRSSVLATAPPSAWVWAHIWACQSGPWA